MRTLGARRLLGAALGLVVLAGCAHGSAAAAGGEGGADTAALVGVWQGEMWELHSLFSQGVRRLTLRVAADGSWTAVTSDGRRGAGTIRAHDGRVVLLGGLGPDAPVHYTLELSDHRRMWGTVRATFGSRRATVMLGLERVGG